MPIVGKHPGAGIRFDLERTTVAAPWVYTGSAFTPDREIPLRATVDADGVVTMEQGTGVPAEVAKRALWLLRSTLKHSADDRGGNPPPRRIHRWRAR